MSDGSKQYLSPHQQGQGSPLVPSLSNSSSMGSQNGNSAQPVDSLTCQWTGCRERCDSAEALYDHVCERHVGRKSTNNLNLTCSWGSCRTTTVKRDHITSHIRVHVPLKPHKCEFCGKSFKRPQDLKKHVKTHADESVLNRSPDQPQMQRPMAPSSYTTSAPSKSSSGGYYQPAPSMPAQHSSYGYPAQAASTYNNHYNAPAQTTAPSYGPVYYNAPQMHQSYPMNSRKRGMDSLNTFFGEAKRRQIQANQYMDLGARFGDVATMGLSGGFGFDTSMMDGGLAYQTAQHPPAFAAPFPELRTKNDLQSLESFLDQLSHTVYEQPDHSFVNTTPLAPLTNLPTTYRTSNSPPQMHAHASYNTSISSASGTPYSTSIASNLDDATPALTPSSYQASQSPSSSAHHASPAQRPAGAAMLYPQLPSISTFDAQNTNGVMTGSIGGPVSSLGPAFDDAEGRRRYSGGFLQRANPAKPDDKSSMSPTTPTAESRRGSTSNELVKGFQRTLGISGNSPQNQNVKLPGVEEITRTASSEGEGSEGGADEPHEAWVKNMKVIEALQSYIKGRLERGEYEVEQQPPHSPRPDSKGDAMEIVKEVESSDGEKEKDRPSVTYPTLQVEMTA